MFTLPQLENQMRTTYPSIVSSETQSKRLTNINTIQNTIDAAIKANNLKYQEKEELLIFFHTSAGEKIGIQYPGKESAESENKRCPYDFRPKIITSDGFILKDLVFADMWSLVEQLNTTHHNMLKTLSSLFFQLGRMTNHQLTEEEYDYSVYDNNNHLVTKGKRTIEWNKLSLDQEIIETLNFFIPSISIDENTTLSFEAFIYFFDMILQNEDSKYHYKKNNLSSGRITTSDSMLLLVSYFNGHTTLSTLLQRFVSGFGVGKCQTNEIEPATEGLIKIVNRKKELCNLLVSMGISYRENSTISVSGTKYNISLKLPSLKIAILPVSTPSTEAALTKKGWHVFNFKDSIRETYFSNLKSAIGI